jgi:hypothetical protein
LTEGLETEQGTEKSDEIIFLTRVKTMPERQGVTIVNALAVKRK